MDGSKQFEFWGSSRKGAWEEGCAGGDRMHTSFVDNPQFILRAKPGTNLCLVLHDVDEDKRQREKGQDAALFLRLCVTAASEDVRNMRSNFAAARPPARPAHRSRTHAPYPRLCAPPHAPPYRPHRSRRPRRHPSPAPPPPLRRSSRSSRCWTSTRRARAPPRWTPTPSCSSSPASTASSTSRRRARVTSAATSSPSPGDAWVVVPRRLRPPALALRAVGLRRQGGDARGRAAGVDEARRHLVVVEPRVRSAPVPTRRGATARSSS